MKAEINARVKEIISSQLFIPVENIADNASFHADLGLDSLDVINLINAINLEFSLDLMENDVLPIESVAELVSAIDERMSNKKS